MSVPVTLAVAGAGDRGRNTYGRWSLAHPDRARVVAVAEPDPGRRAAFAQEHGIAAQRAVADWRDLLREPPLADAVVVATPDREHAAAAVAALELGYDVILEKPIAPTAEQVREVGDAAARTGGTVIVAHVLRYTPFFTAVRRALDDGAIGDLVTIAHTEHIGYWHFAHSFVRGNWRNESLSSPLILAKACHDLDLLRWLAGDRCIAVASFGGLNHFRPREAPPGALDRCWDGEKRCPAAPVCPFDAVRFYVDRLEGVTTWPISVITNDPSRDGRLSAVATGPYGRCVYHADNDVVDHQVVALEFRNGVRATLMVNGLTADNTRTITLNGTRGELRGRLDTGEIEIRRFLPGAAWSGGRWDLDEAGRSALREDESVVFTAAPLSFDGHGGGDDGLMDEAVERLRARRDGEAGSSIEARTSLAISLDSHAMAFAAEASRRERRVVELGAG